MRHFLLSVAVLAIASFIPASAVSETLGRLFFTPEQRNALDAGKRVQGPRPSGPEIRAPRSVTLNGVVTRSDGESTVWVNGRALTERATSGVSATATTDSSAAKVKVGGVRNPVRIRVGQRLDVGTGKIAEPYESRVSPVKTATPPNGEQDVVPGTKTRPEAAEVGLPHE